MSKLLSSKFRLTIACTLLLSLSFISLVHSECAVYTPYGCGNCTSTDHLVGNECIPDISGCLVYSEDGKSCTICDVDVASLDKGQCIPNSMSSEKSTNPMLVLSAVSKINVPQTAKLMAIYGTKFNPFVQMNSDKYLKDPAFTGFVSSIRDGSLQGNSHFINWNAKPVYISVSSYESEPGVTRMKITFAAMQASSVMMGIFSFTRATEAIDQVSFTQVFGPTYSPNCLEYTERGILCVLCRPNFSLSQDRMCYTTIGGCTAYLKNVCLSCEDGLVLIENRCTAACSAMADSRKGQVYYAACGIGSVM